MGFYEELSLYYDVIFPRAQVKVDFLRGKLRPNSKVLDIACGTGTYTMALAELGHQVYGIDLDEEMIKIAKEKAEDRDVTPHFTVGDMRKVKDYFNKGNYDLIYCLGNSLVHLKDEKEIQTLIEDIYDLLGEEGSIIIQIVNYDRIFSQDIKQLPTLQSEDKGVKFIRKYNLGEKEKIDFNTELLIRKDSINKRYYNSIKLLPIRSTKLVELIKKAGFQKIQLLSNFKGEVHGSDSFSTIVYGQKE